MTRDERRKEVVCSCCRQQEHIATIARQEMDSAQKQAADYGANVDRYDSYRTKMMRSRDMYARQLSTAQAGLRILNDLLKLPPFDIATHGACVVTDRQNFFLSIGAGKFLVEREGLVGGKPKPPEVWFAISAQTPIYIALKGKRVGDSLTVNGQTQIIKEIF